MMMMVYGCALTCYDDNDGFMGEEQGKGCNFYKNDIKFDDDGGLRVGWCSSK